MQRVAPTISLLILVGSLGAQQPDSVRARYIADSIAHFRRMEANLGVITSPERPVESGGPFGLQFGISRGELIRLTGARASQGSETFLSSDRVPTPHRAFESYLFLVENGIGVCRMTGIGVTIVTSGSGSQLREAFHELERALTEKYGPPERVDRLNRGSIWNEPQDWMMGLYTKERSLVSYWLPGQRGVTLPGWADAIGIEAHALSSSRGYVTVRYEGRRYPECIERNRARGRDAL